ncbi:hypothetical protein DUNSADRAFT_10104 [Dunaliella salina]|uniref:Uncharacterized protein n=1 Tax=Dunaliella salina TaxID=3046 RepID=A0ABQ7H546_DUNSA|nr:hypothetical protein DUNSADRAFT_10104 [Dunaliella salina]|eukprot:KAF5841933.1 hypothetical protein DUNSADRAFT_10104 [Dunaliella salina]
MGPAHKTGLRAVQCGVAVEILLNIITLGLVWFNPAHFVLQLAPGIQQEEASFHLCCALIKWFGVLLLAGSVAEAIALGTRNDEAMHVLFIGLLVGDFVHMPAAKAVANAAPQGWSSTNTIGVGIALALAAGRIAFFLTKPPSQWKRE